MTSPVDLGADAWQAIFHSAALLLVISGLAKVANPRPAQFAISHALGLRLSRARQTSYMVATLEIIAGVSSLVSPLSAGPALMLGLYLGFLVFILYLLLRGGKSSSCGCFGTADSPPSWLHVGINVLGIAASAWAIQTEVPSFLSKVSNEGWLGFIGLFGTVGLVYLVISAMVLLPAAFSAFQADPSEGSAG